VPKKRGRWTLKGLSWTPYRINLKVVKKRSKAFIRTLRSSKEEKKPKRGGVPGNKKADRSDRLPVWVKEEKVRITGPQGKKTMIEPKSCKSPDYRDGKEGDRELCFMK